MMVPKTPFDVAREIAAIDHWTLEKMRGWRFRGVAGPRPDLPLEDKEGPVYQALRQIAIEGRVATQAELCAAGGVDYQTGTLPSILDRLWYKGRITSERYQKGMRHHLVAEGISTAPPKCSAPHFLDCPERVPTPTIQAIRQRAPKCAVLVEQWAREKSIPVAAMLEQLVHDAIHDRIARENERWD